MSFYVLFFCQYWACWYYVVYCLIKLLAKSALAIGLLLLLLLYLSNASHLRLTTFILTQFCTVNLSGFLLNSHISGFLPAIINSILTFRCVPLTKSCTGIFFAAKHLAFPTFSANFQFCRFVSVLLGLLMPFLHNLLWISTVIFHSSFNPLHTSTPYNILDSHRSSRVHFSIILHSYWLLSLNIIQFLLIYVCLPLLCSIFVSSILPNFLVLPLNK